MMKRIMIIAFAALTVISAQAQNVFNEIYNSSYQAASDPKEDIGIRKVASFKVDALTYINSKTLEQLSDSTRELSKEEIATISMHRDSLAYYMYDYVNLFVKEYQRASKPKEKAAVLKKFRDVSINYPLYNDPDRELVLAYYNREDYLTQFSLDTNWIDANAAIRKKLRGAE